MPKNEKKQVKEAEDALRDILNWVEVWNKEETDEGAKKIDDAVAKELKVKLEKLAKKMSGLSAAI